MVFHTLTNPLAAACPIFHGSPQDRNHLYKHQNYRDQRASGPGIIILNLSDFERAHVHYKHARQTNVAI